MSPTIGIVGGGLMGRLIAYFLVQEGLQPTIYDAGDRSGRSSAAWIAAGMLAPFGECEKSEALIHRLGLISLELWKNICRDITGVFHQQRGALMVAHRQDQGLMEQFASRVSSVTELSRDQFQIDQSGLAALEPDLADRFSAAFYFPLEGQVDPRSWFAATERFFESSGVRNVSETRVAQLAAHKIYTENEALDFDLVIDARGMGAAPDDQALRGIRGEICRLKTADVQLSRPIRLFHPRYPIYVVPLCDDEFIVGATSIESADESPPSVRSMLELLSAAYSLHPGFSEARIIESGARCRPAYANHLPRIVRRPGLITVNGLYRHGFLIGPVVARALVDLVQNEGSELTQLVADFTMS